MLLAMPYSEGIDVVGALDIFLLTNINNVLRTTSARGPAYVPEVVGGQRGAICTWSGLQLLADRLYASVAGPIDTLIVGAFDLDTSAHLQDSGTARSDPATGLRRPTVA